MKHNKGKIAGIAALSLGIGILLAAFFSPWFVICILALLIIIGGIMLFFC